MRFLFKTNYDQDIRLFQHSGQVWTYLALLAAMIAAPYLFSSYLMSQITFVLIYAIVGVSLMVLVGYTGQASLGHAAFLAIGAYTAGFLQSKGIPFSIYFPLAGILTGLVGILVGFPALRLHGIYLLIATISFSFIVEEILARWESVTHGNEGMRVKSLEIFGAEINRGSDYFYYLCLAVLVLTIIFTLNLMRSPTGRAFIAVRDSETAARSMGVDIAATKVRAFGLSAAITGLAGVLYAHKLSFISPEMFTLALSIEFIMVIIIGGALGLHGAILGAAFIVMIDPLLTLLKDDVPIVVSSISSMFGAGTERAKRIQDATAALTSTAGLKGLIYGLIIMLFILFEPYGLYGRWLKIKLFFQMFPLYKKATFKRQKVYVKTERNR
jgi:branched-chain amino acid transport system permease protein